MKEGEKLGTNEARVEKMDNWEHLQKGVRPELDFIILLLRKGILQSSYLITANFSISSLSPDSDSLLTQIRQQLQEQGRKRKNDSYRKTGKRC